MKTIAKANVRVLLDLLVDAGVRHVVVSPGSRNAPVNIAAFRRPELSVHTVIDERVAAFVGLGMASEGRPVAIVCTSGSAVLNFAPAIAEAYYRRVPLIAISADRPAQWIDQRDSQTIRQPGVLANIVRCSVDVPDDMPVCHATRLICDALNAATGNIPGPVHINMPLSQPLTELAEAGTDLRRAKNIRLLRAVEPSAQDLDEFFDRLNTKRKILVAVGSYPHLEVPAKLAAAPGVVFVGEVNSNLRGVPHRAVTSFGSDLAPEVVISIGGALISADFKAFLRGANTETMNIGFDDAIVDTFGNLSAQIEIDPQKFLNLWASAFDSGKQSDFQALWNAAPKPQIPDFWCDATAIRLLAERISPEANVFLANGMCVRYAQLFEWRAKTILANRGVSGIDGCTSTAAGWSMASDCCTVLITGDMGAAYDIGALGLHGLGPNFKMVVVDNGGGDIFRHVATTRPFVHDLEAEMITMPPKLPLQQLAQAYGFAYYEASDSQSLHLEEFLRESERPAILRVKTDPVANQQAYNLIFNHIS